MNSPIVVSGRSSATQYRIYHSIFSASSTVLYAPTYLPMHRILPGIAGTVYVFFFPLPALYALNYLGIRHISSVAALQLAISDKYN